MRRLQAGDAADLDAPDSSRQARGCRYGGGNVAPRRHPTERSDGPSTGVNRSNLNIFQAITRCRPELPRPHLQAARALAKAPAGTPMAWAAEAMAFALAQSPLNAAVCTADWARPFTMPEH
jgi:hypothetical protein